MAPDVGNDVRLRGVGEPDIESGESVARGPQVRMRGKYDSCAAFYASARAGKVYSAADMDPSSARDAARSHAGKDSELVFETCKKGVACVGMAKNRAGQWVLKAAHGHETYAEAERSVRRRLIDAGATESMAWATEWIGDGADD